jgi:hypothetical protein
MALMKPPRLSAAQPLLGHLLRLSFMKGSIYTVRFSEFFTESLGLAPLRDESAFHQGKALPMSGAGLWNGQRSIFKLARIRCGWIRKPRTRRMKTPRRSLADVQLYLFKRGNNHMSDQMGWAHLTAYDKRRARVYDATLISKANQPNSPNHDHYE